MKSLSRCVRPFSRIERWHAAKSERMSNEPEERETVLFTVSAEVAQAAIAQVASCEACAPETAEFPFDCILDRVMLFSGVHTDYLMPEPPVCSRCKTAVTQRTLVEWEGELRLRLTCSCRAGAA